MTVWLMIKPGIYCQSRAITLMIFSSCIKNSISKTFSNVKKDQNRSKMIQKLPKKAPILNQNLDENALSSDKSDTLRINRNSKIESSFRSTSFVLLSYQNNTFLCSFLMQT